MHLKPGSRSPGFTLIELMVTLSLFGILVMLAAPAFSTWLKNAQIRTAAEALQGGLRTAQAEALRRNRQVVMAFTNAAPASGTTAVVNGKNWTLQTVAQFGENSEYIAGGSVAETSSAVTITSGVSAVCFNSAGRLATNSTPGVTSASCTAAATTFSLDQNPGTGNRALRVLLQLGGQIRMCDPARPLTASTPDGCP